GRALVLVALWLVLNLRLRGDIGSNGVQKVLERRAPGMLRALIAVGLTELKKVLLEDVLHLPNPPDGIVPGVLRFGNLKMQRVRVPAKATRIARQCLRIEDQTGGVFLGST